MAFPLQVPGEGAERRELAHERAASHRLHAPRRQKRPDIEGLETQDALDARRLAEMACEKGEELPQVTGIGLDSLCREPPFLGQPAKPRHRLLACIRRAGEDEIQELGLGFCVCHRVNICL